MVETVKEKNLRPTASELALPKFSNKTIFKWPMVKIKKHVYIHYGKALKKGNRKAGNVPVYGTNGITGWHNKSLSVGPSVIIGRVGAGPLGVEWCDGPFWVIDCGYYTTFDLENCNPKFFYYFLKFVGVNHLKDGTSKPTLNRNVLGEQYMPKPPLYVQDKVADILSSYDLMIKNNTCRIQILEEMAQRIYREWIVNFRYPRYETESLVESELGLIPERWKVSSIGKIIEFHIGGGWGKEEEDEKHNVPAFVIRGTDIPHVRHGKINSCPFRFHTTSNLKSRKLADSDIVFEVSGGSKDQPLGRSLLIKQRLLKNFSDDVICASFCKLIRPNKEKILPELLYLHLLEIYRNRKITKYQVQSTGISNFKFSAFLEDHKLIIPEKSIQKYFGELVIPILEQIFTLGIQNSYIRQSRDLLIPKLLSGKIDVSEFNIDIRAES